MRGEQLRFSWTFPTSDKAGRHPETPHARQLNDRREPVTIIGRPACPNGLPAKRSEFLVDLDEVVTERIER